MVEVKPDTKGYYEVVWADLSGNQPERRIFHTKKELIRNLEGGYWYGGVILAVFGPNGKPMLEELEEQGHIHDENH